jgi:carbonic anhydrase
MQNNFIPRTPSMADIAKASEPRVNSPKEAIQLLVEGNARFFNGEADKKTISAYERRMQIVTQTPFAVILGCSDSRVPVEMIFDQGPGDLFVVRVAGNVVETGVLGTIEFAIKHLNVAAILVLGHEGCGIVQLALESHDTKHQATPSLRALMDKIEPAVSGIPKIKDDKARMREAVVSNVRLQVAALESNETISSAIKLGKIGLMGGFYEIGSGAVDFLDPI